MAGEQGSREAILARVRSALAGKSAASREAAAVPALFPPVANLLERFAAECEGNFTECHLAGSEMETRAALEKVLSSVAQGHAYAQDSPGIRRMMPAGSEIRWSSESEASEDCQVTITGCECLVANTGSIFVSAGCGGRRGSIVAPVHIVIAHASQLVPDLTSAFSFLAKAGTAEKNSFAGLITGCSRTADIEKLLVIGAHGPRRLAVILQTGD